MLILWVLIYFLKISDKLCVIYRSWNIIFTLYHLSVANDPQRVELLNNIFCKKIWPLKRQLHKVVEHTQTIRGQQPTDCLSVFDQFVGLKNPMNSLKKNPINFDLKDIVQFFSLLHCCIWKTFWMTLHSLQHYSSWR